MVKKNKLMVAAIGLAAGACVFATTAMVALANNSNYEIFKNSVFNMPGEDNYTVNTSMKLIAGGDELTNYSISKRDGDKVYSETKEIGFDGGVLNESGSYSDRNTVISYKGGKIIYERELDGSQVSSRENKMTDAQKRLMNILIDTAVGDTKNSMLSEGSKIYLNLKENQIPMLAQAVIGVISEGSDVELGDMRISGDLNDEVLGILNAKGLSIKEINFEGDVDPDGNFKYLNYDMEIGGTVSGEYKAIKFEVETTASGYGSTVVEKPNIAEYDESVKSLYFEEDGTKKPLPIEGVGVSIDSDGDMVYEDLYSLDENGNLVNKDGDIINNYESRIEISR
ncbi:MAG: hypothetical protein LBV08_00605 [Clostridiales bacterium]|jgi:hypothetical protein|nr:hypothetical protein [Clostridiales bacterium]